MLHPWHGDGLRRQMPEMPVTPCHRYVQIHELLVLLLFGVRVPVGYRCGEWREEKERLAGRGGQARPLSAVAISSRNPTCSRELAVLAFSARPAPAAHRRRAAQAARLNPA